MLKKHISGIGLIEVMIAASILAVALLGAASIQSQSLNVTRESSLQETTIRMINGFSNFILIMQDTEVKLMLNNTSITEDKCNFPNFCESQDDLYASLFSGWRNSVSMTLPSGKGCVCLNKTDTNSFVRVAVERTNLSGKIVQDAIDNQFILTVTPDTKFECTQVKITAENVGCNFGSF